MTVGPPYPTSLKATLRRPRDGGSCHSGNAGWRYRVVTITALCSTCLALQQIWSGHKGNHTRRATNVSLELPWGRAHDNLGRRWVHLSRQGSPPPPRLRIADSTRQKPASLLRHGTCSSFSNFAQAHPDMGGCKHQPPLSETHKKQSGTRYHRAITPCRDHNDAAHLLKDNPSSSLL